MDKNNKYRVFDALFIAWEKHRRTIELSHFFSIPAFLFFSKYPRVIRHPFFILRTILLLFKKKPRILFVQSPSLVLALLACFLKKILGFNLVIDAHNAGLGFDSQRFRFLNFIFVFMQKNADVTIVTNDVLARGVLLNGGRPFVLPDKIPDVNVKKNNKKAGNEKFIIVYICTFSCDEPYHEFLQAILDVDENIHVYVTGNYQKHLNLVDYNAIDGLTFTGFLSEDDYWQLLSQSNLVVDLTYRENCLVCGAYEAVSLEKPMLLSKTIALRKYFKKGVVFTGNNKMEIKEGVTNVIQNYNSLLIEIKILKKELDIQWLCSAEQFLHMLESNINTQNKEVNYEKKV